VPQPDACNGRNIWENWTRGALASDRQEGVVAQALMRTIFGTLAGARTERFIDDCL
jgi:hypothetical protein